MSMRLVGIAVLSIVIAGCGESTTPTPPSPAPPPAPSPSPTPAPTPTTTVSVSIVAGAQTMTTTAFNPNPIAIATGTTVIWMNNDTIFHTTTANGGSWDSGVVAPGATFSRTFTAAGTFPYHCSIHPNMVGTVVVQ